MSWDVMVFRFRGTAPPTLDGMREADLLPLGPAVAVRAAVLAALPDVDWTDPSWGVSSGVGYSIEFNVGKDDPIDNMMLHVRGGGDAIAAIMAVVVPNGWAALDCSTSEFLDPINPSNKGWQGFQAYRDKVVARPSPAGEG